MKNLFVLIFSVSLVISLASCGSKSEPETVQAEITDASEIGTAVELTGEAVSSDVTETTAVKTTTSKQEALRVLKVGETFLLGKYEQDNDTSNGKEDIEWRVLAKEGNRMLIVSEYALDYVEVKDDEWITTTIRKMLNNQFYETAFSEEERSYIKTASIDEYSGPDDKSDDKVFLLSIAEVEKYFNSEKDRICENTKYATAKGALQTWWLRRPGYEEALAFVGPEGDIGISGGGYRFGDFGVRPAMWIEV